MRSMISNLALFSQKRMQYPGSKAVHRNMVKTNSFGTLEWPVAICSHDQLIFVLNLYSCFKYLLLNTVGNIRFVTIYFFIQGKVDVFLNHRIKDING
jgi:hypothetical protein